MAVDNTGQAYSIQTVRVSSGSMAPGTAGLVVTWPQAWADTNYTVRATAEEANAGDTIQVAKAVSKTTTTVTLRLYNNDVVNRTATIHVIGIHD